MSMDKVALTGTNLVFSTRSMALAWILDVPEAGADWRLRKGSAGTVGCRVEPKEPPTTGSHAGEVSLGITSMRLLSKGTFGVEMHLIP